MRPDSMRQVASTGLLSRDPLLSLLASAHIDRSSVIRVTAADFLEERYPERPATLRARWRKTMNERIGETDGRRAS